MVIQLVIKLYHTLQVANLGLFLVTHSPAYKNKELFKTVYDILLFSINIYDGNAMTKGCKKKSLNKLSLAADLLKHVFRRIPHPQFLKWYKAFSWRFGSHDNPLTRQ